jgi:hypothetical protein
LYSPFCEPENVRVVDGLLGLPIKRSDAERSVVGAAGGTTVSTRFAFLSSFQNRVSKESLVFPSLFVTTNDAGRKVLSPSGASVVILIFLKIAVCPSDEQERYVSGSDEESPRDERSAVTRLPEDTFEHPL